MATLEVPKRAVKANANLLLTYEPTFYGRADGLAPFGRGAGLGAAETGSPSESLAARRVSVRITMRSGGSVASQGREGIH
jgi:hypothetical protein